MAHRWAHASRDSAATQARRRKYASREHREASAAYKRQMDRAGVLTCWRCRTVILRGARWHVGHDDVQVDLIRGPEHAGCNLAAAARKGNRVARARKVPVRTVKRSQSRAW